MYVDYLFDILQIQPRLHVDDNRRRSIGTAAVGGGTQTREG